MTFNINGLASTNSDTLTLYGAMSATGSSLTIDVYPVADSSWDPSTVTWDTQPSSATAPVASFSSSVTYTPGVLTANITSYIQAEAAEGFQKVSIALKAESTTSAYADLDGLPDDPGAPYMAAALTTATLYDTADSYVSDGSNANTNFGSTDPLLVQESTSNSIAYLKFDTSSLPSGTLGSVLMVIDGGYTGTPSNTEATMNVFPVADTSWGESTITWNNSPAIDTTHLVATAEAESTGWYTWDITDYVNAQRVLGNNVFSVAIASGTTTSSAYSFHSREAFSLLQPALVVNTGAPVLPTSRSMCGEVDLGWVNPPVTGSNVVYRSTTVGSLGSALSVIGGSATQYADTTAVCGTTYYYTIQHNNSAGMQIPSGGPDGAPVQVPGMPNDNSLTVATAFALPAISVATSNSMHLGSNEIFADVSIGVAQFPPNLGTYVSSTTTVDYTAQLEWELDPSLTLNGGPANADYSAGSTLVATLSSSGGSTSTGTAVTSGSASPELVAADQVGYGEQQLTIETHPYTYAADTESGNYAVKTTSRALFYGFWFVTYDYTT